MLHNTAANCHHIVLGKVAMSEPRLVVTRSNGVWFKDFLVLDMVR